MLLSKCRAIAAVILVSLAATAAGTAGAVTLPFKPTAQQGVFLHVSDIHFDPFTGLPKSRAPAILQNLIKAPIDQWAHIFQNLVIEHFAPYGKDTNFPLFTSMLAAAKGVHYDYVLNTGDNVSHGFRQAFQKAGGADSDYQSFVVKTLRFVDLMLRQSFPGAPLIYAPGNNDAVCGDYKVAPNGTMLAQVGRGLPVIAGNRQARRDFAIGGFYIVPHPTVPRHDIIVLNSIFWSVKYVDECSKKGGDPGAAELAWLEWTLYREKLAGRTATLAMHIPPGINAYTSSQQKCPQAGTTFWRDDYTNRFAALVGTYKDVLRASYAGHTHMDDFRVLSDASGTPLLTTRITPAVSPIFGNNPAFTVLLYDRSDAVVRDYATFYLANLAAAGPKVAPQWKREYTFAQTYAVQSYTPSQLAALAKRISQDSAAAKSYMQFYPVDASTPINQSNLKAFACAQTALTPAAYAACRCP